jgi:hypothetical protein
MGKPGQESRREVGGEQEMKVYLGLKDYKQHGQCKDI